VGNHSTREKYSDEHRVFICNTFAKDMSRKKSLKVGKKKSLIITAKYKRKMVKFQTTGTLLHK